MRPKTRQSTLAGKTSKSKPEEVRPDLEGSSQIIVGDLIRSNVAIGTGASVIINQALTAADQARAQEDYEREKLAQAIAALTEKRLKQASAPDISSGSPYKYLLPYELIDTQRFYGRDEILKRLLSELVCDGRRCRFVLLQGDAGIGKTSLLHAGILPSLVSAQHLPLTVRVTPAPLVEAVKASLVNNLNKTPILKDAPLLDFLRQAVSLLPDGKHVFVLLDQFEAFFEAPLESRYEFVDQVGQCVSDEPAIHWLISIRSAWYGHLETFARAVDRPFASSRVVPPLSEAEALAAILRPAQQVGLSFEDGLVEQIIADLGGEVIEPARLQLVCHTLVEELGTEEKQVTREAYEQIGSVAGVLRDHLDLVLERNLLVEDRPHAWQLLSTIAAGEGHTATTASLLDEMRAYEIEDRDTHRLLGILESSLLVRRIDERWSLASPSLLVRIKEWSEQRDIAEQVLQETRRQLQRVRDSALRGLVGGSVGFSLAYLLAFFNQFVNTSLLLPLAVYRAFPGAFLGLFLTFFVDIARASYHGPRRWMRWLVSGLAGASAFAVALVFHAALNLVNDLPSLLRVAAEGAAWGVVAGLSANWVLESRRPFWQTLTAVALSSGLVLWLGDHFGQALHRPGIPVGGAPYAWQVFLAGMALPLLLVAAVLIGRERRPPEG